MFECVKRLSSYTLVCVMQPGAPSISAGSSSAGAGARPPTRSINDHKIIDYLMRKLADVEKELKNTKAQLADLQSKDLPATAREAFLLDERETVNLQLECKCSRTRFEFLWLGVM